MFNEIMNFSSIWFTDHLLIFSFFLCTLRHRFFEKFRSVTLLRPFFFFMFSITLRPKILSSVHQLYNSITIFLNFFLKFHFLVAKYFRKIVRQPGLNFQYYLIRMRTLNIHWLSLFYFQNRRRFNNQKPKTIFFL